MFHQTGIKTAVILALLAGLAAYAALGGYFARELVIEIATLAILAISLDMVAGYGGMVSLCHGSIFGLGAYGFAVAATLLGLPPGLALVAGIALGALFGGAVGAVTSRARGIFFIMATLAFGQMVYVLIFDARALGGDDGLPGVPRLDLSALGVDLQSSLQFALFAIACLGLVYALAAFVLRSGFGRTLCGIHANEARMRALGVPVWQYKANAFALSGAMAGFAGALAAQHTMFVSPEMMVWTVSGEALVIVILGGMGTLVGPAVGAALLILLRHEIASLTNHWHMVIGIVLIVTVLAGGRGLYGQLEHMVQARRERAKAHA
ncbi:branched-chain amino acid ABC transporter permease [Kaustia mangrovi]|uniref:Branched-chain amino acid ABC transporter permease n=1 Tax=Kaustia mangrovi TaxID=2593653 RepID=A0A7S8C4F3_9HYPH|nr:branched-chain amino acid ABC transporter permease [Kaustia mangrovi]QPC43114.1 branched-chain amino acid ABC transporter permease [Kaustia mangrovi]